MQKQVWIIASALTTVILLSLLTLSSCVKGHELELARAALVGQLPLPSAEQLILFLAVRVAGLGIAAPPALRDQLVLRLIWTIQLHQLTQ